MANNVDCDIIYDINDITVNTKTFYEKLNALATLREDNKVGIHDNKLYVEFVKHKAIQMWVRKWYKQTRQDIDEYLKRELDDYSMFLDMVYQAKDQLNNICDYNDNLGTNKKLVKGIIIGLEHIKNVYNGEYTPIDNTCSKYITSLNDKIKSFDW